MPQVPTYDSPKVSPDLPPDVRGAASAEAFGAGTARGMQKFGQTLGQAAQQTSQTALAIKARENEIAAKDADNEFAKWRTSFLFDPKTGYFATQGKDALDQYQVSLEAMDKKRHEIASRIGNEQAKKLFLQSAHRANNYAYQAISRHALSQGRVYEQGVLSSRIETLGEDATLTWQDDDRFGKIEYAIKHEAGNLAKSQGQSPEQIKNAEANAVSGVLAKRIAAASQFDLEKATKLFDENYERMNTNDRMKTDAILKRGRQSVLSENSMQQYGVKRAVESDLESIRRTGAGLDDLDYEKVRANLGEKPAKLWLEQREDNKIIWDNTNDLASATNAELAERVENLIPQKGSKNFLRELRIYDAVRKAVSEQSSLRITDPAQSVESDPAVQAARMEKDAPFEVVVDARMDAQERAGIASDARSPITQAEAAELLSPIQFALPGTENETLKGVAKAITEKYGPYAEEAFAHALRLYKMDAEKSTRAGGIMKQIIKGDISQRDAVGLDAERELSAAERFTKDMEVASPQIKEPEKQVPLSERILKGGKIEKPKETSKVNIPSFDQNDRHDEELLNLPKDKNSGLIESDELSSARKLKTKPHELDAKQDGNISVDGEDVEDSLKQIPLDQIGADKRIQAAIERAPKEDLKEILESPTDGVLEHYDNKYGTGFSGTVNKMINLLETKLRKVPVKRIQEVYDFPTDGVLEAFEKDYGQTAASIIVNNPIFDVWFEERKSGRTGK